MLRTYFVNAPLGKLRKCSHATHQDLHFVALFSSCLCHITRPIRLSVYSSRISLSHHKAVLLLSLRPSVRPTPTHIKQERDRLTYIRHRQPPSRPWFRSEWFLTREAETSFKDLWTLKNDSFRLGSPFVKITVFQVQPVAGRPRVHFP